MQAALWQLEMQSQTKSEISKAESGNQTTESRHQRSEDGGQWPDSRLQTEDKDRRSAASRTTPVAQKFQVASHVSGSSGIADSQQTPSLLSNGECLLIANDDARVVASMPNEFRMKPTEIGRVVTVNGTPLFQCPRQLPFV